MKKNYQIAGAGGVTELETKVQKLLEEGWSLQGGVSCMLQCDTGIEYFFYQAMSKGIKHYSLEYAV